MKKIQKNKDKKIEYLNETTSFSRLVVFISFEFNVDLSYND